METKIFDNVNYGDYVRCNKCEQVMLLPHGADKCPFCGSIGNLSWVNERKKVADIFDVKNGAALHRPLKRSDYTSAAQMWEEDYKKHGVMRHSDIYEMCQKIRRQEQAELKAALEAHGGSFTWLDDDVSYCDLDHDVPIVTAYFIDDDSVEVAIAKAWLDSDGSINLSARCASDETDLAEVSVWDIVPGHLCSLIDCMTATAEVNDVSMKIE